MARVIDGSCAAIALFREFEMTFWLARAGGEER